MKTSFATTLALGGLIVAQVAKAQFDTTPQKTEPTNCKPGIHKLEYSIKQETVTPVYLEPGATIEVMSHEPDKNATFGKNIHKAKVGFLEVTTNGDFDAGTGCGTPACMSFNKFANARHGILMLSLRGEDGQIVETPDANGKSVPQAFPVTSFATGKTYPITKSTGVLTLGVNDSNMIDNEESKKGVLTVRVGCPVKSGPK